MGKYRNLILNLLLFALNSVATKFISFFLVPLYTSYMSAGEYGITDMANTVISLLIPLVTLDVSDAAVRFIVDDQAGKNRYAAVSLCTATLSVLIVSALSPFLDLGAFGGLGEFKAWFVVDYAATALMALCGSIARGKGEVRLITIASIVSSVVTLICAVVFISVLNLGIIGYFASVSIGPACAIAVYFIAGGIGNMVFSGVKEFLQAGAAEVGNTLSPMIRYALPLIPNSLFWWMGTSINRLFITSMLGISASGMFAAAGKIPSLINTAYSVFQQAWQLSAFQESKNEGIATFYSTVFRVVSSGLFMICSLLSFCSPYLAMLLLRGETYGAWTMIPILLLANLMNVFNSFYGTVYTSTMHTKYVMHTTIFGALSCVVFTPLLIPVIGTVGACCASVIGQGLVFVMRAHDSQKYIAFDAGWRVLLPTIAVLAVQSLVTAVQLQGWQTISLVCVLVVYAIHIHRLLPLIEVLKKKLFSGGARKTGD